MTRSAAVRHLYDTDLELLLGPIENDQARVIQELNTTKKIPTGIDKKNLLKFILIQYRRIEGTKGNLLRKAEKIVPNAFSDQSKNKQAEISDKLSNVVFRYMIEAAMSYHWIGINDLSMVILENTTDTDFIFSDHPVVFKNLMFNDPSHDTKGLQLHGLVIFIPTNHKTMLILYDLKTYFLRSTGNLISLNEEDEVQKLNLLQFYNCHRYLFFSNKTDHIYLQRLYDSNKGDINKTRKRLIMGSIGPGRYPVRPDSGFTPKLSFVKLLNVILNDQIRDRRICNYLVSSGEKFRKDYFDNIKITIS